MPTFKEMLAADRVIRVFSMARIIHPIVIDMFGLAGRYDGFWLDQEHGGLTYEQINLASVAARANGMDTFVRMAPIDYSLVTQALEAGAGGVMAARIESAAQAREFVSWSKFHPAGSRGINTGGWDARYTHMKPAEFAASANRAHLVAIQIETLGALEEVDAIAACEGVDLLFVGPNDLSQAMGLIGQLGHERVWEAIDRVQAACIKHGKHWGTVPADPAYADRAIEKGCRMLIMGGDVLSLRIGIEATQKLYERVFSR
ncbi:MAG: hypothetical protein K1X74_15865 [Pirellulales bacterium]|nr:hypothetical protein [Pirellulales bacterium]